LIYVIGQAKYTFYFIVNVSLSLTSTWALSFYYLS